MIYPTALKLCANGGMKLEAGGLASACCDPCELAVDAERRRIKAIPLLVSLEEHSEGLLVYNNSQYKCKAAFCYSYYASASDSSPTSVLEYFDCENCERTTLYSGSGGLGVSYRHYPLPDICSGCIIKMDDSTLLATIDDSGPDESGNVEPIKHLVFEYTNSTGKIQYIYWTEGGNETPINAVIDNWAVMEKDDVQDWTQDIYYAILYPGDTARLYAVNQANPDGAFNNPWEIHVKVYMAEVTCDPCEIKVYNAMHEPGVSVYASYGPGFYTGGGGNAPYKAAFVSSDGPEKTLWGFTCDTCEKVMLWRDESSNIPYTEDATACDGEGEVQ